MNELGIRPSGEKKEAITKIPIPKTVKAVQSFIGMASYYRKFIQNFSSIAAPLTSLTKKNVKFVWRNDQQKAFELLKIKLTESPVLRHFVRELKTEVRCDGSYFGLGEVLIQYHEDGAHPVPYTSRKLVAAEKNYPVSELEALRIFFALEKFRIYVMDMQFRVITDHCCLCWLLNKTKLSPRLTRWAMVLQDFNFEIIYKSGKEHKDADCLSRYPVENAFAIGQSVTER